MKLMRIELCNYRQYKGKQKIDLSTDSAKNFTIIEGVNGAGKTNLLNAITWCLYGVEDHLSKYPDSEKLPKYNERVFLELEEDSSIECYAKLTFGEKKADFRVERYFDVRKLDGGAEVAGEKFDVWYRTDRGWTTPANPDFVVKSRILPYEIRNFFFFDGERLDEFFKMGGNKYVERGILDVAQIGLIDKAYSHLDTVMAGFRKSASKGFPDLEKIQRDIESKRKKIERLKSQLEEKEKELMDANKNLAEIESYLRSYPVKSIQDLQTKRDSYKEEIEKIDVEIGDLKEENTQRIITSVQYIYAKNAIVGSLRLIEKETQKGRIPPSIRDTFIRELLESEKCICGTDISSGPGREKVESLLKTVLPSKIADLFDEGKYKFMNLLKKSDDFKNKSVEYARRLKKLEERREECEAELSQIDTQLGKIDEKEVLAKESQRQVFVGAISDALLETDLLKGKIRTEGESMNELTIEFGKKTREKNKAHLLMKKIDICERALQLLSEKKQEIVDYIRKEVESNTKEFFFNLIWKKGAFRNVVIGADYKISVTSEYGKPCLGTLSAGERQILALSFMAALYTVSGFDAPMIIDTPLARISGEHRRNIAKALPEYLNKTQVTLFMTDTEYTNEVRKELIKRVGKEYKLEFKEKITRVKPYERK